MVFRHYSHYMDQGEPVITHEGDYPIDAFAYTKENIQEALRACKAAKGK
jgi:hypothetical protein